MSNNAAMTTDAAAVCSAKGCRRRAIWAINWRNPRIHTAERRKTWLACDEHRGTLEEFLSLRGFPLEVETFGPE